MAIDGLNSVKKKSGVSFGNRNDYCYLCALELDTTKGEVAYNKAFNEIKGKLEGQKVLKINRGGTETCICKEHVKNLATILDAEPTKNDEL